MADDLWIDELERDLGPAARRRLVACLGGQRREVPRSAHAARSVLAGEVGPDIAAWLAARFGGTPLHIPSGARRAAEERGAQLRAAILDAGLDNPTRSANELAAEFGVTSAWVHKVRGQMRAEREDAGAN